MLIYTYGMFIGKVIDVLNRFCVPYALVGGYAVALHGALRGTVDIDIAIALDRECFEACEQALHSIGLQARLPVTASEVFAFREEYIAKRNMIAWSFVNAANPTELVDILITEDANKLATVSRKAFGMEFRIAAIPELIAMKRKSARAQDIEDIKALERLQ